jgi:preprotein translocase subunit SecA
MAGLYERIFGSESTRFVRGVQPLVARINSLEPVMEKLSAGEVKEKTKEFKARLEAGETLDELLPEAFALVREAAKRTLNQRHYDVQLIGGIALHRGAIAEMRTGEGKTLCATLPAYLNALTGKGVHIVTVNDYLAKRDGEEMGQVYAYLGLTTGVLNDMNRSYLYDETAVTPENDAVLDQGVSIVPEVLRGVERKEAYQADITYGTNSQFGFDYLRDNTQISVEGVVSRGHHFAIVDEVDSVLIDEARVPLILSAQSEDAQELYNTFAHIASKMIEAEDYEVDEKLRAIQLTPEGIKKAERELGIENIYTAQHVRLVHHLETAVRAKALFLRDREYVVRDGNVLIVDTFTGRMQEGRRYSDGLHQAIEAKEGVKVQQESKTLASITYQNFFKLYEKLAGMTGTAETSSEEFEKVYNLRVLVIPPHRPNRRIDHNDLIYQTEEGKFKAVAAKIKELHAKGQPVLVGTVSVEKNELLSLFLRNEGIPHEILNAKNHEREAEIIADAGKKGAVTIATNMAGRGVDIKLGGIGASKEMGDIVRELGGLYVLGTERHEARRIDNQLRGRSGRQGDPGETQFFVSLDDALMRVFGGDKVKSMIKTLGMPDDMPIQNGFVSKSLEGAQEKVEGFHFDSRKHVLSFDDVLSHHRTLIYERRRKILAADFGELDTLWAESLEKFAEAPKDELLKKRAELGDDIWYGTLRRVALYTIDRLWMDHLEMMDYARQSVNLRAYGQREPLIEYKKESLRLFRQLEESFAHDVVSIMSHVEVSPNEQDTGIAIHPSLPPVKKPDGTEYERNDKVVIIREGMEQEVKYKNLHKFLHEGWEVKTLKR